MFKIVILLKFFLLGCSFTCDFVYKGFRTDIGFLFVGYYLPLRLEWIFPNVSTSYRLGIFTIHTLGYAMDGFSSWMPWLPSQLQVLSYRRPETVICVCIVLYIRSVRTPAKAFLVFCVARWFLYSRLVVKYEKPTCGKKEIKLFCLLCVKPFPERN